MNVTSLIKIERQAGRVTCLRLDEAYPTVTDLASRCRLLADEDTYRVIDREDAERLAVDHVENAAATLTTVLGITTDRVSDVTGKRHG